MAQQQSNKRRYVFHFDINNTCVIRDAQRGLSVTENVSP